MLGRFVLDRTIEPVWEEQIEDGIEPGRIILAGFSQGGAVVLEAGHIPFRSSQVVKRGSGSFGHHGLRRGWHTCAEFLPRDGATSAAAQPSARHPLLPWPGRALRPWVATFSLLAGEDGKGREGEGGDGGEAHQVVPISWGERSLAELKAEPDCTDVHWAAPLPFFSSSLLFSPLLFSSSLLP